MNSRRKWERNAPLPGERLLSGRPRGGRRPAGLDRDTRIRASLGDGQTKAGAHKCAPVVWNAPKSAVSTDFRRSSRSTRAVGRHDRRGFPGFRAGGAAASSLIDEKLPCCVCLVEHKGGFVYDNPLWIAAVTVRSEESESRHQTLRCE